MSTTKNVFLTGADGMLGSHICRHLLDSGYSVKALVLNRAATHNINGLPIEITEGNILKPETYENSLKSFDYVIHAAARLDVWPRKSTLTREINMQGTMNIMQLAEKHKLKRMVYIGSASSFGHGTLEHPGTEQSQPSLVKMGMDYINSKYEAQQLVLQKARKDYFPAIVINPTFMIGAYDSKPSSGKLLLQYLRRKLPGTPPGGKNFVWAGDVAAAAVNALEMGKIGECYIAGHQNLSYKSFFDKISSQQKVNIRLFSIPKFIILGYGLILSAFARIFGFTPSLSYSMAEIACLYQFYSPEKAVKELNMPQTPIEEAIAKSVHWFRENGYL